MTTSQAPQRLQHFLDDVGKLLVMMPKVHKALHDPSPFDKIEGWEPMVTRCQAYLNQDDELALVSMLLGPSGAGKSTVFTLLTGLPVPAGGDVRPLTHASMAAVPPRIGDFERLAGLFPGYTQIVKLDSRDDYEKLKERDTPLDLLFYSGNDPALDQSVLPLVLVDAPDFNTTEEANWDKAERMLARAEVIVFIVYPESYKDDRVIKALRRCCGLAGYLAYFVTKTDQKAAQTIWADLLRTMREKFSQEKRKDKRTIPEFLESCPAYFSPRSKSPKLEDIQPITSSSPSFVSLLGGEDGVDIILTGLLEPTQGALR